MGYGVAFWEIVAFYISCETLLGGVDYKYSLDVCQCIVTLHFFIPYIGNLCLLFFSSFVSVAGGLLMVDLSKEPIFCLIFFLYCFALFNFIDL